MLNASSSKIRKESLKKSSLESKVSSQQSTEEMGSEDSDRCEPNSTEEKHWYELLKEKIGFDINAKKWMEKHPELAYENKSELLIRLACEVCLAKNTKYDPENENEEQNNKYIRFDTQRIFALFEVANELIDPSDRKNFVEFVCQKGNVKLLEMICQKETKGNRNNTVEKQYKWRGTFTGYSELIDLLQYVIDNRCSQEIVLCVAEKIYGHAHIFYNGEQYLDSVQANLMKASFNYQGSVVKVLLKQAVKLGYKDAVSVMLSGDIYHSIRLMKWKVFKEKPEFLAAYNMIKETAADVISSWVEDESKRQSCKESVQKLLDRGIEINFHKMVKEELIYQLEYLGKEVKDKNNTNKKKLVQELEKLGKEKGEVRLRSTTVGALISTLFFKHRDEAMKGKFTLKITLIDNIQKRKTLDKLNKKISNRESIEDIVLELIKSLSSCSYLSNNWFFREVLVKVVNENLDQLKAVCATICKEPMEELLKGEEVHEDVTHVLQFFGVEVLSTQVVRSEIPSSCASTDDHFMKDINVYFEKEAKEDCSSDELAFSGLTRKIIRDLEEKQDLTDEEKKDLIFKAVSRIKEGINILADGTATNVDAKDMFLSFELINSKIEKEKRREIVELICQKGNVQLLEMICQKEKKDKKGSNDVDQQYKWKGMFTGYSKLMDLLQYVIDNRYSQEIVLCITKKVYGHAHIFYNGEQYLDSVQANLMKASFNYQDSVVKELLKQVIKLDRYKDTVSVMLSGDTYQSIRLIKWQRFQERKEFVEAYHMIKQTVVDVISSWVEGCKDDLQRLLDRGIEVDLHEMSKEDLIFQLTSLGAEIKDDNHVTKKVLMQKLKKLRKDKGEVRLRSTVVGAFISVLFFRYQDKAMKGEPFTLNTSDTDNNQKRKVLDELNQKTSNGKSIEDIVLKLIQPLNSASHLSNNWFFREVLVKVVNENLDKLKAVCAAICKEPMEELLRGEEVHEDVIDVLHFFGVDTHSLKRDLGSVESQETFEYTDSSSATETNKLSSQDIVDIAKYYYKWMEPINGKYLEGTNKKVFFTCTDLSSLEDKLKHYKKIQQKDLIFTSIINTGKEHLVTLVVARNVQGKDVAYYCDSFGKKKIPSVLKKALKIDDDCIGISQIKQQENEYNCGIFALANAYKITGMIKGKSFTEINIELKGKFDIGQLRKEFAKKVKEMQQKSGVDSEEEVHEPMEVEDGVDALSNQQPSAETSHDLPELSIAGPSRVKVKVLSSVLPDLKAAERKNNEEVMRNNCRHNHNIFDNRRVIGGEMLSKTTNWGKSNRRLLSAQRTSQIIKFSVPEFSDFVSMFDKDFQSNLLKYEFDYERLQFLLDEEKRSDSDEQSCGEEEDLNLSGLSLEEHNVKIATINEYDEAITCLMNGETSEATSKLSNLAEKKMPHAQYALAIIQFKNLWLGKVDHKDSPELDKQISKIVEWLSSENLDENLRPLNRSLLLKIRLYDIGGYGEKVKGETDDLLNRVLHVTQDTKTKFDESLVGKKSMVAFGTVLEDPTTNQMNDCEIIIRCAMYEVLKKKILERGPHTRRSAIEDAFSKICKPLPNLKKKFEKMFKPLCAEMIYGHAINLLIHNQSSENNQSREEAVKLLEESFQSGNLGASYLLGTLLYRKKGFNFIFEDNRYESYFSNLEKFAIATCNKTAVCIVANEYLISSSRIKVKNKDRAQEILEETGHESLWKEVSSRLSGSDFGLVAEDSPLRRTMGRLRIGSVTKRLRNEEDFSPQLQPHKRFNTNEDMSISMPQSKLMTSTVKCEDMMGKRTIPSEFISSFDDQRLNSRSILLSRKEYFFLTRKGDGILDSNFSDIEEYCKKGEYSRVISHCENFIGLKGAGYITDDIILKAYYNKGEALFVQGEYEDAIQVLEKALDLNNLRKKDYQQISFARLIAEICCKAGKYDKAISILKEVSGSSDKNLNALIDKDIKEIKNIQSSRDVTKSIFLPTRPSTSMSGIESGKHMVEGKKK